MRVSQQETRPPRGHPGDRSHPGPGQAEGLWKGCRELISLNLLPHPSVPLACALISGSMLSPSWGVAALGSYSKALPRPWLTCRDVDPFLLPRDHWPRQPGSLAGQDHTRIEHHLHQAGQGLYHWGLCNQKRHSQPVSSPLGHGRTPGASPAWSMAWLLPWLSQPHWAVPQLLLKNKLAYTPALKSPRKMGCSTAGQEPGLLHHPCLSGAGALPLLPQPTMPLGTLHRKQEVLVCHASSVSCRAGIAPSMNGHCLVDLQSPWEHRNSRSPKGQQGTERLAPLLGTMLPSLSTGTCMCPGIHVTRGQDAVAAASVSQLGPIFAPGHGRCRHPGGVASQNGRGHLDGREVCPVISDRGRD